MQPIGINWCKVYSSFIIIILYFYLYILGLFHFFVLIFFKSYYWSFIILSYFVTIESTLTLVKFILVIYLRKKYILKLYLELFTSVLSKWGKWQHTKDCLSAGECERIFPRIAFPFYFGSTNQGKMLISVITLVLSNSGKWQH